MKQMMGARKGMASKKFTRKAMSWEWGLCSNRTESGSDDIGSEMWGVWMVVVVMIIRVIIIKVPNICCVCTTYQALYHLI